MKICAICGGEITGRGHAAHPYDGRCCDECHVLVVLPARVDELAELPTPPLAKTE